MQIANFKRDRARLESLKPGGYLGRLGPVVRKLNGRLAHVVVNCVTGDWVVGD